MCPETGSCSRREFCVKVSQMAAVAGAAALGIASCTTKNSETFQTTVLDLNQPQYQPLQAIGGAAYATNESVIVYRASVTQVNAFSSACTHLGCTLPLPNNGVIVCGCHSSTFDTQGNVTGGPATSNLTKYYASLTGMTITISDKPLSQS